jgi:hypothetical protein
LCSGNGAYREELLIFGAICTRDSISVDKSEVQSWRTSSPEAILKQIMVNTPGGDRGSNMNVTCRDCHVR